MENTNPPQGIRARFAAWYKRNIVEGVVKSWSFLANAAAIVVGILPDLINLALDNWGMVGEIPVLSPGHKLVLFAALHIAALLLRTIKQKNMPGAPSIPVALVNVPSTVDVPTSAGGSVSVATEIHVVDKQVPVLDHVLDDAFVPPTNARPVTFGQLYEYGVQHAASLVDGVPWSFTFEGHAVTHENDDLYLINDGITTHRLHRGDVLWLSSAGILRVEHKWSPTP